MAATTASPSLVIAPLPMTLHTVPQHARIALYGTGKRGRDYLKIFAGCRPDVRVVCFLDSFGEDTTVDPPIRNIENLAAIHSGIDVIIITSAYHDAIACRLQTFANLLQDRIAVFRADWFVETMAAEEIQRCESMFAQLARKYPEEPFVSEALGHLALQKNAFDQAIVFFKEAQERNTADISGFLGHIAVLMRMQRYADVVAVSQVLEKQFPGNIGGYLCHIDALMRMHRYEEAASLAQACVAQFPGVSDGYCKLADVLIHMQKYDEAEPVLQVLMEKFSDTIGGYCQYADMLTLLRQYDAATAFTKKMEELFPTNIDSSLRHVETLLLLGRGAEAEAACLRVLEKFPGNIKSYLQYIDVLMRLNNYDAVERVSALLEQNFPDSIESYLKLIEIALYKNQCDVAVNISSFLEKKFPHKIEGFIKHVDALLQSHRLDEAEAVCRSIEQHFPDTLIGHIKHIELLIQQSLFENALSLCEKIKCTFKYVADIYLLQAYTLHSLLRYDEEKQILLAAHKLFKKNTQVMEELKRVHIALEEFAAARAIHVEQRRLLNASQEPHPSKHKKILFYHVPKCGGMSVVDYLASNYTKNTIFQTNPPYHAAVAFFLSLSKTEREAYDFIAGHETDALVAHVSPDMLKTTMLRNPVDRLISSYYYYIRLPFVDDTSRTIGLDAFIQKFAENIYIQQFSTAEDRQHFAGDALVERTFRRIQETYDLVGITEKFTAFLDELRQRANLPKAYGGKKVNVTYKRKRLDDMDPDIIKRIEVILAPDIKLYTLLAKAWD